MSKVQFASLLLLRVLSYGSVVQAHSVAMHNPSYTELQQLLVIKDSNKHPVLQSKISDLVKTKIKNRECFYGIEVSARSNAVLDYDDFAVRPLFTSIIWVGDIYANLEPIIDAPPVKCEKTLKESTIVMPHITCYNMTVEKLEKLVHDDLNNALLLRGDSVSKNQTFMHALDLVKEVRRLRGDNISIAVAAYPEGHPETISMEKDLQYLKEKVDNGADLIITQMSYSSAKIIDFIKQCRKTGITVPIIPGIFIPFDFKTLKMMKTVTKISPPIEQMEKYAEFRADNDAFQNYAVENTINLLKDLFSSNLDIFGVQFFTGNYFRNVQTIVNKMFVEDL